MKINSKWIGVGELGERYGVGPDAIRSWESSGLLPPATRTKGGQRRWLREDIVDDLATDSQLWLAGHRQRYWLVWDARNGKIWQVLAQGVDPTNYYEHFMCGLVVTPITLRTYQRWQFEQGKTEVMPIDTSAYRIDPATV